MLICCVFLAHRFNYVGVRINSISMKSRHFYFFNDSLITFTRQQVYIRPRNIINLTFRQYYRSYSMCYAVLSLSPSLLLVLCDQDMHCLKCVFIVN